MKEMLLLGAGASVEAGIPDSYDMTKKISEHFRKDSTLHKQAHVISFVVGGLLFQQGVRGEDPLVEGVNVEDLFNAVQLLAERDTLEAAAFVGSWHAMVEEFDKESANTPNLDRLLQSIFDGIRREIIAAVPTSPPPFCDSDIDRAIQNAVRGPGASWGASASVGRKVGDYVMRVVKTWSDNLKTRSAHSAFSFQSEFQSAIRSLQEKPGEGKIFGRVAENMVKALTTLVWIKDKERVKHLEPLLRLAVQQKRLIVTTLNYDNSVELLAQAANVPCNTGIAQWSGTGSFDFTGEGIQLLKLHGSIDWVLERGMPTSERPLPHTVVRSLTETEGVPLRPAVIFGQRNKLTVEGPFLDLLRAFQLDLNAADRLTVIGYSFRDDHINEYISQWLNKGSSHRLRVINPGFRKQPSQYGRTLMLLGRDRVEVLEEKAGDGLMSAYPVEQSAATERQSAEPSQP